MAQQTVNISRGATDPDLEYICAYTDGTVQDLTGWTVTLVWAPSANGASPDAGYTRTVEAMTVTDATAGKVSYAWAAPLNATERICAAQVHATNGVETIIFPEPGTYISIKIHPSLAA